jgi:hypothetical protein
MHTYLNRCHTHTHIHTHIHTYECISTAHIHTFTYTHIHTYIHADLSRRRISTTHIHTHTYIHTYIHTYTDLSRRIHTARARDVHRTYICNTHTYIHTHTHTQTSPVKFTRQELATGTGRISTTANTERPMSQFTDRQTPVSRENTGFATRLPSVQSQTSNRYYIHVCMYICTYVYMEYRLRYAAAVSAVSNVK